MAENKSWTSIDKIERVSLVLGDEDICYYYLVRTDEGYTASDANSRIENFKKPPERYRDIPKIWWYKNNAIEEFANDVIGLLLSNDFEVMLKDFPAIRPLVWVGRFLGENPPHQLSLC